MEFTAGLGAQDARLTCSIPGNNGENRQPGGKKYNKSGNHGENDAFTQCGRGETSSLHLPDSSLSVIYAQSSPHGLFFKNRIGHPSDISIKRKAGKRQCPAPARNFLEQCH